MADYETLDDDQLIRKLRAGEEPIADYIMEKYKNMVRREARAMYLLGGEKEDLIQEGMIGLFKAVRDYDAGKDASFYNFAVLCVRRQLYSAIEAAGRKKHIPLNSYVSLYEEAEEGKTGRILDQIEAGAESDPEQAVIGRETAGQLETELKESLSDLERSVLKLHLCGTEYRDIAGVLGKSPKAIDNALQRIKTKTERILAGYRKKS